MRVSAIADWTTCEAMAISDPHPEARVHVAAWVGTLAHALLSGSPLTEEPTRLDMMPSRQRLTRRRCRLMLSFPQLAGAWIMRAGRSWSRRCR